MVESGGFLYDSDAYNDDLPYWTRVAGRAHLIVPYSFDNNDSRLQRGGDFATGEEFYRYNRDAFDWLYRQGSEGRPRMLSIGLHARVIGRPGRIGALERLLDYMLGHEGVWFCSRAAIARHWTARVSQFNAAIAAAQARRPWRSLHRSNPGRRSVMSQLTIILIRKYSSHVLHGLPVPPARHRARDVYLSVSRNHRPPDSARCRAGLLDTGRRAAAAARGWMLRTVRAGGTRADSGTRHAGGYAHREPRSPRSNRPLAQPAEACAHALPGIGVLAS